MTDRPTIWSYCLVCPDDSDTLPDALDSLTFCDKIFLLDGGNVSLIHHPRNTTSIKEWIKTQPEYAGGTWRGVPVVVWENEFQNYGAQRNAILEMLGKEPDQPTWLVWIDSDEVCSDQMKDNARHFLASVPPSTEGVYVKWLNLVQDEQHCAGGYHSTWLSHPRIVKVGNHRWVKPVHEHMEINRSKLTMWDVRVIHSRALFRRRLLVQRSHRNIRYGETPLWSDTVIEPVPDGVTWKKLRWPVGDFPIPIDADASLVWDAVTGKLIR